MFESMEDLSDKLASARYVIDPVTLQGSSATRLSIKKRLSASSTNLCNACSSKFKTPRQAGAGPLSAGIGPRSISSRKIRCCGRFCMSRLASC